MGDRHTTRYSTYSLTLVLLVFIISLWLSKPVTLLLDLRDKPNVPGRISDAMDQDYLSLLPNDVIRQVCASASSNPNLGVRLNAFSKSDKHLRDVSLPNLFRNVVIRGEWEFARSRLETMEYCHEMLPHIKIFKLDVDEEKEPPPPQSTLSKLAKMLTAMPQLEKLVFVVPEYHSLFEEVFRHTDLVMPSVDILVVGPHCEFMVAHCPNVGIVSTNGYQWVYSSGILEHDWKCDHSIRLIKAAGAAPKLRHLEMMELWRVPMLEAILEFAPNISSIGMDGGFPDYPLEEFLPTLSRFQNLRTLALAGPYYLNVGFDPYDCGNECLPQIISEEKEAEVKVAHMVLPVCANLKELWIGDTAKATVERYAGGGVRNIIMSEGDRGRVVRFPHP